MTKKKKPPPPDTPDDMKERVKRAARWQEQLKESRRDAQRKWRDRERDED